MAEVVLEKVYKRFPQRGDASEEAGVSVLRDIDLTVRDGEFLVLVGPSGCGKSTLLRLIAGLESLTAGKIYIGDRLANDLPPKRRDVAMVFQSYALYPHLTVYENLAFGLRRMGRRKPPPWESLAVSATRKFPKPLRYVTPREREIAERVQQVAQMLQIEMLRDRLPKELSGGQKQRVALGRAIARDPAVFLMDEPLSNLDAKLRSETRGQLVELQRQLGTTTVYVTHDRIEAMTMGDRIAVMNAGQLQQVGAPLELYERPANRFVAEFLGSPTTNFISVRVKDSLKLVCSQFRLTLPSSWEKWLRHYDGQSVWLGVRPEHLSLSAAAAKNLQLRIDRLETLGSETYVIGSAVDDPSLSVQARLPGDRRVALGDVIWLAIDPERVQLFDMQTERAIGWV
uniref:ABC transporter ATP-binding protein n=2 Tax=Baaleninema simplex TaxID=2862350 RepID=UPI000344C697|nr:ABC transporter ATP-binding protein [Baaleninema simplex]